MAITLTDFDKIWASTSPLTPYSFTDANYQQGWNFVGATPPARQMWDSYMKFSDEKQQYIVNNFLPLSGGTMTGNIFNNNANDLFSIAKDQSVLNQGIRVYGGNSFSTGASLYVYGKDNTSYGGIFRIFAHDGTNSKELKGTPAGSLTWLGKEVERVNSIGSNYIRFEGGLQICWGSTPTITTATTVTLTLPAAFVDDGYSIAIGRWWVAAVGEEYYTYDATATSFKLTTIGSVGGGSHSYMYIAIGKWK